MDTTTMLNELVAPGTSALAQDTPATLDEVIGTTPDEVKTEPAQQTPAQPLKEPGYLAGKRAEWEAAHKAEMNELRGQLDTLREYFANQEADKLVADGKIADKEMALQYVRATKGIPTPASPSEPAPRQRDEQGRFVSAPQPDAEIQQKAAALVAQAETIMQSTGVDVMALYNTNPEIKQKVLAGEWSFVDVYKNTRQAEPQVRTPAPIRSANGVGIGTADFRKMSGDQFHKVNELLESGGKIDVR